MNDKDRLIQDIVGFQEKANRLVLAYRVENWMKLELTIDQLKSLILIHSQGKISFKDLARSLSISRSNITGLADRLIQNGLLTRNRAPEDRRIQYLMLTDTGRKIMNGIKQEITKDMTRVLNTLNVEELGALEKGLGAFIKSAEKDLVFQPYKK